jgi:DNA-binding NtrC family response regulator
LIQRKKIIGITPSTLAALKKYDWPGNIRELENVIEHSFILEESNQLTIGSLPESFLRSTGIHLENHLSRDSSKQDFADGEFEDFSDLDNLDNGETTGNENEVAPLLGGSALDFNVHKEAFEREFIVKALKAFKGRINQTALHANIPKKTLLRKIEKYGIVAKDYA